MSESSNPRHSRWLAVLVAFLIVVTAVQGYYLFRVHHQMNANIAYATENQPPRGDNTARDKTWHVTPNAGTTGTSDPLGSFTNKPFDPNSWNPFSEMEEIQKQVDRMFEQAFGHFNASPKFNGFSQGFSFNPKSDVEENDHEYTVRLDIPGTDSSKIKATIADRTLSISGTREEEVTQQGASKQLRNERRLGQFERVLTLPGPVKQEGMKANYKDGVLTITIPKDAGTAHSNTIPIE